MAAEGSVGVFDSGVGGLSVLREIRWLLPHESLLYFADSAHAPYGEKSPDYVRRRADKIANFLLRSGAKALVVACNTATAAAASELRASYPQLPIIAMEPAVKPAVAATRNGMIGVLATSGTLRSARFVALRDRFAGSARVLTQPCPGLMEQVEKGDLQGPDTEALLRHYLEPLLAQGCDTLVLGCTHYPFLRPLLARLLPPEVKVVDTGAAVARHLQHSLAARDLLAPGPDPGALGFWTSGAVTQLEQLLPQLWGESWPVGPTCRSVCG